MSSVARPMRSALVAGFCLLLGLHLVAPVAAQLEEPPRASIVASTEVLGSILRSLAGDVADVTVLMDGGTDPHSWQPSARDTEAVFRADLIVANGLDLEEGLVRVLEQAESEGVPVFHATDHVNVRASADAEGGRQDETEHETDAAHGPPAGDPHFWLDPMAMRDVVLALGPAMADANVDIGDAAIRLTADLEALDAEIGGILSSIPDEGRRLVTGHGAWGYFADRYGLEIVGTMVPGLSSSDEPSARDIARLVDDIREAGATVLFTDVGTPQSVAEAVADETGAQVVELPVAQLPDSGTYADLLRELASSVAAALSGISTSD